MLLFYLAPLPILIAALGWSHLAGLLAALFAAAGLALAFGFDFFLAFLFGVGLPAWWLGYLALLGRPVADGGRCARMVSGRTPRALGRDRRRAGRSLPRCSVSAPTRKRSRPSFAARSSALLQGAGPDANSRSRGHQARDRFLVVALPPAAAVLLTIIQHVQSLARGPHREGVRTIEPAVARPGGYDTAGHHAGAAGGGDRRLVPARLARHAAGVLAASLFMAYALMGFAVLHAITRGMGGRGFMLGGAYVAVVVLRLAAPRGVAARTGRNLLQHPRPLRRAGGGSPHHRT